MVYILASRKFGRNASAEMGDRGVHAHHRGHRGGVSVRGVVYASGVGVGGCVGREGGVLVCASGPRDPDGSLICTALSLLLTQELDPERCQHCSRPDGGN